jgi:hypothetical protein
MPTLIDLDSFQHQVLRTAITGAGAWYALVTDTGTSPPSHGGGNITFDTGVVRTADHIVSLKMAFLAARGIQVRRTLPAGFRDVNVSFYFRTVDTTNPSGAIAYLFVFGSTTNGVINLNTSGQVSAKVGVGTTQTGAVDVCDGAWHRIDARYITTTTTGTLDVQVDGTALTQATGTVTVADQTDWNLGFTSGTVDYTVYYQDLVVSGTGADYPMGDHICKKLEINGTGTHSQGAGAFTDEVGGTSDAALLASINDAWNGTTPELSQTGEDYVKQTANDAAGYVEFTVTDPTESSGIWGAVHGSLFTGEDSALQCNGMTQLVDSAGTIISTTGTIDPSSSATIYNGYRLRCTAAPAGGWDSGLAGVKLRFGFSSDASPFVAFNAGLVEYAAAWTDVPPEQAPLSPLFHVITGGN